MFSDLSKCQHLRAMSQIVAIEEGHLRNFIDKPVTREIEIRYLRQGSKTRPVAKIYNEEYGRFLKVFKEYLQRKETFGIHVTGYIKGRSIVSNAQQHVGMRVLLKADIKNFFYSIKTEQIAVVLSDLGFEKNLANELASLFTYDGVLFPGLNTSPVLSNYVMKGIDERMLVLAKAYDANYSRYSDDMAFSSNDSLPSIDEIDNILNNNGFRLNRMKTFYSRRGKNQVITGLSVADKTTPRIPRHIKCMIKTACMLYNKIDSNEYNYRVGWCNKERLFGLLRYYHAVEPVFVDKMERRIRGQQQLF